MLVGLERGNRRISTCFPNSLHEREPPLSQGCLLLLREGVYLPLAPHVPPEPTSPAANGWKLGYRWVPLPSSRAVSSAGLLLLVLRIPALLFPLPARFPRFRGSLPGRLPLGAGNYLRSNADDGESELWLCSPSHIESRRGHRSLNPSGALLRVILSLRLSN